MSRDSDDPAGAMAVRAWLEKERLETEQAQAQQQPEDLRTVTVSYLDAREGMLMDVIGEEVAITQKPLFKAIAELRAELETVKGMVSLRGELEQMKSEMQALRNSNVTPLRSKTDAKTAS